jgi:hypothetical protein
MSIYDRESMDWEFEEDTMDWPWPAVPLSHFSAFYEPCPCCDLGTVHTGPMEWECPACAGSGMGKPHAC